MNFYLNENGMFDTSCFKCNIWYEYQRKNSRTAKPLTEEEITKELENFDLIQRRKT